MNKIPYFRLHDHFPNCCLPQALGGDVPDANRYHFYEFCKERAPIVEEKYNYLKSWSKKGFSETEALTETQAEAHAEILTITL